MEITVEYKQKSVELAGTTLFYKIAGEGKPLLVIHGWGATSSSWMGVVEEMTGEGFQIIIPDLPGFGKSPEPKKVWGTADYASIILKLIKELGLNELYLLGHSFGGGIALRIATEGNGVEKLILCDAAVIREERLSLRQHISKGISRIAKSVPKDFPGYRFFEKMVYRLAGVNDYYRASPMMKEIFKKVVGEDLRFLLGKIKQECLIIWGSEDKATPLADAFLLNREIRGSDLKIIPGARHNPYKTNSKETAEAITKFLNK